MKRSFTLLLSALLWTAAACAAPLVTDKPVPWNDGTVQLGDSEAQVRAVAGKYPDRAVPLNPGENVPIGEQWMFIGQREPRQTLWVELIRGRVTRVWTEPLGRASSEPPKPAAPAVLR